MAIETLSNTSLRFVLHRDDRWPEGESFQSASRAFGVLDGNDGEKRFEYTYLDRRLGSR